jgi:hypothetical protein
MASLVCSRAGAPNILRLPPQAGRRDHGACPNSPAAAIQNERTAGTSTLADVRLDIYPSFENDSDMVSAPPGQLASADRSKVVERDEKIYRKKPEFI